MSFRSKLGWGIAAILSVALIYRGDDKAPSPPSTTEPTRPVTQWPAKQVDPTPPSKVAPTKPVASVTAVRPQEPEAELKKSRPLFTTARVRIRAEPNTKSVPLATVEKGTKVTSREVRDGWHTVSYENIEGWIRSDYLTDRLPEIVRAPDPPPVAIISRPTRRAAEPVRAARAGEAIRQAVTGSCDCPYDRMRNGRRCGGNSAWSKPGGRQPVCFVGD